MIDGKRLSRYQRVADQLSELIAKTEDRTAHCATAAALLHHKIPGVSWTGFYFIKDGELVVDAYQGPVACLVLKRHEGVCWAAIDSNLTQLVADVHAVESHIACDANTRSEVVVPIHGKDGAPIGVLDIDSHKTAHFSETDATGYELIVDLLENRWNTPTPGA